MKLNPGEAVTLKIDNLAFGGSGVGRVENLAVFVPYTVPGETVQAQITEVKDSWLEAEVLEIVDPSPHRVDPPCPYFKECGGCQWQHIAYPQQIEAKINILREALTRIGKIQDLPETEIEAAPEPYRYRIRAEFNGSKRRGSLHLGFCQARSRRVIDVTDCLLVPQPISETYAAFRSYLSSKEWSWSPYRADFSYSPGDGKVHIHYLAPKKAVEAIESAPETAAALPNLASLGVRLMRSRPRQRRLLGDNHLLYPIPAGVGKIPTDLMLKISEGTFFQVNHAMNLRLVDRVVEMASLTGSETVLDIYSGAGNFTLPLAFFAKRVIGIEDNPLSTKDGVANARSAGLANCQFLRKKAEEVLEGMASRGIRPEVVVLDPPRPGAKPVIPSLVKLSPDRIIYVSCNPTTLARDVQELVEGGYQLNRTVAVDLFPQTFHLESVSLLTRK